MKNLLTAEELIAHMKNKGIKFNIIDENEARVFLSNSNYYMKLASYRTNYEKHREGLNIGKYVDLEFAYLKELSSIDKILRYEICEMCLDIEHYLKVKLLNLIEKNSKEDGYKLIQNFIAKDSNLNTLKKIQKHKGSEYCKNLIEKYYPYFPAWVFVELISFGELTYLCSFYDKLYDEKNFNRILLNSVRDIRNACAHSNCLINMLLPGNNKPNNEIIKRVRKIKTIGDNSRNKKLTNKCIYDFVCLLYAYDEIVSSKDAKQLRFNSLKGLFEGRLIENAEWFINNEYIKSAYDFSKKILDFLLEKQ